MKVFYMRLVAPAARICLLPFSLGRKRCLNSGLAKWLKRRNDFGIDNDVQTLFTILISNIVANIFKRISCFAGISFCLTTINIYTEHCILASFKKYCNISIDPIPRHQSLKGSTKEPRRANEMHFSYIYDSMELVCLSSDSRVIKSRQIDTYVQKLVRRLMVIKRFSY